ncbi:MAG: hypothetical protein SFU25_09695 [Candidatus Caenarcaniphilales bacterium]|nr:hypothetical protein [Candidatus Caenarcaniphilales bacterium]
MPRFLFVLVLLFVASSVISKIKKDETNKENILNTEIEIKGIKISRMPIEIVYWIVIFIIFGWIWTTNPPSVKTTDENGKGITSTAVTSKVPNKK